MNNDSIRRFVPDTLGRVTVPMTLSPAAENTTRTDVTVHLSFESWNDPFPIVKRIKALSGVERRGIGFIPYSS